MRCILKWYLPRSCITLIHNVIWFPACYMRFPARAMINKGSCFFVIIFADCFEKIGLIILQNIRLSLDISDLDYYNRLFSLRNSLTDLLLWLLYA